jgi:hypothetical protein
VNGRRKIVERMQRRRLRWSALPLGREIYYWRSPRQPELRQGRMQKPERQGQAQVEVLGS